MPLSISASDLLPLIPLSARTILEVGCGEGELAAAYRRMNPKARLLGIEINSDAAALAALHLEQVSTVDVEAEPLPFAVPDGIDCIVYNDVLHHLRDPWAVIRRHADALNLDGMLLIRLSNIEYLAPNRSAIARRVGRRGGYGSRVQHRRDRGAGLPCWPDAVRCHEGRA